MTQLEQVKKKCSKCGERKALTAFYPSQRNQSSAQCKSCASSRSALQRYSDAEKLYFAFGESEWSCIDAASALKYKNLGMSSKVRSMQIAGLVHRIGPSKYRVIPENIRAVRMLPRNDDQQAMALEVPAAQVVPAPTVEVIPQPAPQPVQEVKTQFLRAGSHLLSLPHIVDIEIAPDDSVSVMLNVQETRKDGYIAPVSFKFEGCDGRAIIDSISVLQGDLPAEQIKQYEDRCNLAERDRDAALALAAELEKKLSDIRARLQ